MESSVIEYVGDKESPIYAKVFIDGKEIHGVSRISFEHSAGDIPEVQIDIGGFEIDMHAFKTVIESERAKILIRRA